MFKTYAQYPFQEENLTKLDHFFKNLKEKKMNPQILKIKNILNNINIKLAESYGLEIVNKSWIDTSRFKNSNYGKNITDVSITIDDEPMPIIRKPNYIDITCDRKISDFKVTVGNEIETDNFEIISPLKRIDLKKYLENINIYTNCDNLKKIFTKYDEYILCSSQLVILPNIDKIKFNININNYNSSNLIIISTYDGTSAQIITEKNQIIKFNKSNNSINFFAKLSNEDLNTSQKNKEKNIILIYQIPIKTNNNKKSKLFGNICDTIERDDTLPIRCTLQYFKISESNRLSINDIKLISKQIEKIYDKSEIESSLIIENTVRKTIICESINKYDDNPIERLLTNNKDELEKIEIDNETKLLKNAIIEVESNDENKQELKEQLLHLEDLK